MSAGHSEAWWRRILVHLGLHFCKCNWRSDQDQWCPQCWEIQADTYHHATPSGVCGIGPKFILQWDKGPKHTAKVIENYLWHKEELEVVVCPPHPWRVLISTQLSLFVIIGKDGRIWGNPHPQKIRGSFSNMFGTTLPRSSNNCVQVYLEELTPFWRQRMVTPNIHLIWVSLQFIYFPLCEPIKNKLIAACLPESMLKLQHFCTAAWTLLHITVTSQGCWLNCKLMTYSFCL